MTTIAGEVQGQSALQRAPGITAHVQLLPSEQIIRNLLRERELQRGAPESEIRGQRAPNQQLGHTCWHT